MLDLRYVRTPIVGSALFAAFAVYFGVFAIFFLTALYLDVGLRYSGWKLAGMFAPMAAAIVVGGLAAGPLGGARPARACRWSVGCVLGAVGMLARPARAAGSGAGLTFALLAAGARAGRARLRRSPSCR